MRKPRDYDSELKALDDKAKALKGRKVAQLGELVIACKADQLAPEILAGALLAAAANKDAARKEDWRKAGEAFFRKGARAESGDGANRQSAAPRGGAATPGAGQSGA